MIKPINHSNGEYHLFIIWENARSHEAKILHDIGSKFEIINEIEITWSKEKFSDNLSRFYGTKLPARSGKEEHVGTGPFLLVLVKDINPVYDNHETSRGLEYVNSATFTQKTKYRKLTGGGHRIHATNSIDEFNHDIALLLGPDVIEYLNSKDNRRIKLKQDLVASNYWDSLEQLFWVLNHAIKYVVMRNYEPLPNSFYAEQHGDIDILTADYLTTQYILNSTPVFAEPHRVHNKVLIEKDEVLFDFRYIGDSYYDTMWEQNIIDNRVIKNGIYVMNSEDHFYSLLYHSLIHKPHVAEDYIRTLKRLNGRDMYTTAVIDRDWFNSKAQSLLGRYLAKAHYSLTVAEPSVFYNYENIQKVRKAMWRTKPLIFIKKRVKRAIKI